uniref:Protein fantom n=1 Tax=Tetraselmis sp. GSL018 TaxID=582737 RepID=A0A061R9T6_9CHLO
MEDDDASDASFGYGPPFPTRRPIKVAWTGGTKVDEENFLKMQEDYLRVMTLYNESEKQRKQAMARLARAEEAAKRMATKGEKKGANGTAAARLFEMEGQLHQVAEENTQIKQKLARERKANEILRERNKQLDLQARKALADYQRLLRASKQPKGRANPRNSRQSGLGRGGVQSQSMEDTTMQHRYMEQQEELANLHEENEYLRERLQGEGVDLDGNATNLNKQLSELRKQLAEAQARLLLSGGANGAQLPGQSGNQASAKGFQDAPEALPGSHWELHDLEYDGHVYLLDPKTKIVYSRPSSPRNWPQPLGRMTKAEPIQVEFRHQTTTGRDFFVQLDGYLKGERTRLREVFDKFDADGSNALERSEVRSMAEQLVPGIGAGDLRYLIAMLDANGDGAVTYEELMDAVADVVHAGQAAKDGFAQEMMQVLSRVREELTSRGQEVEDMFADADVGRTGALDFVEIAALLRRLLPSVDAHEIRFLVAKLHQWDVDGRGMFSLEGLKRALQIGSWAVAGGGLSPARSPLRQSAGNVVSQLQTSLTGQKLQEDLNRLYTENIELKQHVAILSQQTAELDSLRRDAEEARLQAATAEDNWLRADPSTMRRSIGNDVSAELTDAWNKVRALRQRWLDAKSALDTLRNDYTNVVNKLDDIHKQLNSERKARFRAEKDKEFWRLEAAKYRELEPQLDSARRTIADLEKENQQAFANVFHAPEGALAELKHLKTELLEVRKAKASSESREAEARKEVFRLRGMDAGDRGDVQQLRADKQRLERDLNRAIVDLEALRARVAIYERSGHSDGDTADGPQGFGPGGEPLSNDAADLQRQLHELNSVWHEDKSELDKVRKLLEHEEEKALALQAQLEELRANYEHEISDKDKKLRDTDRIGHRQVERLEERIRKLEAQLRNAYSQGWKKGGVRSSAANGSFAVDLDEELSDLAPSENIFELHLASAALDEDAVGRNPPTFLTVDFFEHETQASSVVSSTAPEYDHTIQYVLQADTFFLEYLDTKSLVVELNRSKGWDFEVIGTARIPLQQCLDDFRLGAAVGRNRQYHYTDILGPGGRYLGRLRWSASMLKPIDEAMREYRRNAAAKKSAVLQDRPPDEDPAARAIALAATEPHSASHLRICVRGCRGLRPNVAPAECMPYVSYTFPGTQRPHYTPFGRGVHPTFDDEMVIPIVRTRELETFFTRAELELEVFDDADRSTGDSSIIGVAALRLQELADGLPIEGTVPLYSAQGRQRRGDVELIIHWHNPLAIAHPPGAGDREAQSLSGERAGVRRERSRGRSFTRGADDSSLSQLANKPRPIDDPDELQSVAGLSERSDMPHEADELSLLPSGAGFRAHRQGASRAELVPDDQRSGSDEELPRYPTARRRRRGDTRASLVSRLSEQESFGRPSVEKRYREVGESFDLHESLPLVRDFQYLPQDWSEISGNSIIIQIESVRLGSEVFHDPRVTSVFVMYEFLPEFVRPEEQVTNTHPKTSREMEFNFCTAISCGHTPELHRRARYAIGEIMRTEREDAYIPFCLVSDKEDEEEDYHEFGFAEVNLHKIYAEGDLIHENLDVVGPNTNEVVAALKVTIIAQKALQNILSDIAP